MQATAKLSRPSLAERLRWNDLIAPWLLRLAFLGVGVLVGLYMIAPRQARASDTYLPPAYVALPNAVVQVGDGEGLLSTLPVKLADTVANRNIGFTGVGSAALDNQLLLFGLTRETTARVTYAMNDVRSPLQVIAFNGDGLAVTVEGDNLQRRADVVHRVGDAGGAGAASLALGRPYRYRRRPWHRAGLGARPRKRTQGQLLTSASQGPGAGG